MDSLTIFTAINGNEPKGPLSVFLNLLDLPELLIVKNMNEVGYLETANLLHHISEFLQIRCPCPQSR